MAMGTMCGIIAYRRAFTVIAQRARAVLACESTRALRPHSLWSLVFPVSAQSFDHGQTCEVVVYSLPYSIVSLSHCWKWMLIQPATDAKEGSEVWSWHHCLLSNSSALPCRHYTYCTTSISDFPDSERLSNNLPHTKSRSTNGI